MVIPTYNRRATLVRVLRALGQQSLRFGTFEVLVIADGCTDDTVACCQALADELPYALRLIMQENTGPAAARNRGVREARAPLIVFIDDDVVPASDLLAAHVAAHAPGADDQIVALGPLLPPEDQRLNAWGAWEERTLLSHYEAMTTGRWAPTYRQFYTGNASLAQRHILDAGGFDQRFRRAEDVELGLRLDLLGCDFIFLPQARAWHYVQRSFASWARMPVAYGEATVTMAREHRLVEVTRVAEEYQQRNHLVKGCVRLCLGSSWRVALATHLLQVMAVLGSAARLPALANASCSILYNLLYYAGVASGIGGASRFWQLIQVDSSTRDPQVRASALHDLVSQFFRDMEGTDVHEREEVELGAGR